MSNVYRELAEEPKPIPRSWWQRQNWACRLGLHALKKKYFGYIQQRYTQRDKLEKLRWWKRGDGGPYADREYVRCTRDGCNYAALISTHFGQNGSDSYKTRLTNENQLPPSLRRKKLLK